MAPITRKYPNPPLVEAICEFHFTPTEPSNNFDLVDDFYETIKGEFPIRSIRHKVGVQFVMAPNSKGPVPSLINEVDLHQFKSADNTNLVQIGENLITVNHLNVYTNWEIFKPVIEKNLARFLKFRLENSLSSAVIRYINRIDLDKKEDFMLSEYFNFDAKIPEQLPQGVNSLFIKVEVGYENGDDICSINLRSAPVLVSGKYSFFFDITYESQKEIEIDDIDGWLEQAHSNLNNVFESCLTEKCKEKFN